MSIKPNEIIHQVVPPSLKHPKHYHHHITIILSSAHWTDFLKKQRHLSVMLLLKVLPKRRHYRYLPFLKRSHWQPPTPCIVQPEFILGNHWVNWVSLQSTCEGWCRVVGPPPFTHRLALKSLHSAETGSSPGLHKWTPLPSRSSAIHSRPPKATCNKTELYTTGGSKQWDSQVRVS